MIDVIVLSGPRGLPPISSKNLKYVTVYNIKNKISNLNCDTITFQCITSEELIEFAKKRVLSKKGSIFVGKKLINP